MSPGSGGRGDGGQQLNATAVETRRTRLLSVNARPDPSPGSAMGTMKEHMKELWAAALVFREPLRGPERTPLSGMNESTRRTLSVIISAFYLL